MGVDKATSVMTDISPSCSSSSLLLSSASPEVISRVSSIITDCERKGVAWIDPDFPHDDSSLFIDPTNPHQQLWREARWMRVSDVFVEPSLFVPPVNPDDIRQGKLGNCWFMSALAVLTLRQEAVFACFVTPEYSPYGVYAVRFFKDGSAVQVIIDDYIPVLPKTANTQGREINGHQNNNNDHSPVPVRVPTSSHVSVSWEPLFAQSRDGREIWCLLLEKAFAKLYHSYQAIEGGWVDDALVDLTGGLSERLSWQDPLVKQSLHDGSLWTRLLNYSGSGFLLGCGSPATDGATDSEEDATPQGIIQGHAYSVLGLCEVEGHHLIHLRNPWGRKEWQGDWCDQSPLWNDRLKAKVGFICADDGAFWMCWDDFVANFDELYICRFFDPSKWISQGQITGQWSALTAGGCCQNTTVQNNIQYAISVVGGQGDINGHENDMDHHHQNDGPVEVAIELIQSDLRGKAGIAVADYPLIILELYDNDGEMITQQRRGHLIANKGAASAEIHIEAILPNDDHSKGKLYTLLPCTYLPNIQTNYVLRWYATQHIHIQIFDRNTLGDTDQVSHPLGRGGKGEGEGEGAGEGEGKGKGKGDGDRNDHNKKNIIPSNQPINSNINKGSKLIPTVVAPIQQIHWSPPSQQQQSLLTHSQSHSCNIPSSASTSTSSSPSPPPSTSPGDTPNDNGNQFANHDPRINLRAGTGTTSASTTDGYRYGYEYGSGDNHDGHHNEYQNGSVGAEMCRNASTNQPNIGGTHGRIVNNNIKPLNRNNDMRRNISEEENGQPVVNKPSIDADDMPGISTEPFEL